MEPPAPRDRTVSQIIRFLGICLAGALAMFVIAALFSATIGRHEDVAAQIARATAPPAPPPPVTGWIVKYEQTVALNASDVYIWGPVAVTSPNQARFRVTIEAQQPLDVGTLPFDAAAQAAGQNQRPNAAMIDLVFGAGFTIPCAQRAVLAGSSECTFSSEDPPFIVFARDNRKVDTATGLGVALLGALGAKGPLQNQVAQNRVTVKLAEYGCVRNCDAP